jgi:hypothetical protein
MFRHQVPEDLHEPSRPRSSTGGVDRVSPGSRRGSVPGVDERAVADLLAHQDGVVSRRQVLAAGGTDDDIERLLRRRVWARIHLGVYVDHTGAPSRRQRHWAAVLFHWPAALSGPSALEVHGVRRHRLVAADAPVHVAVDGRRSVASPAGVLVHRVSGLEHRVLWHLGPPRVRIEHALIEVASQAQDEDTAIGLIADACQTGRTTPRRLLDAVALRPKLPRRRLLVTILADVACGAYSVLERRYLVRVERPHGLPGGQRQRRVRPGRTVAYRDVEYVTVGVVVELDGRLGHEAPTDRWKDLDRDLDAVVQGDLTVRVGWGLVLDPCRLAAAMVRILLARGWTGRPHGCGPGCPVARVLVDLPAPGAGRSTRIEIADLRAP